MSWTVGEQLEFHLLTVFTTDVLTCWTEVQLYCCLINTGSGQEFRDRLQLRLTVLTTKTADEIWRRLSIVLLIALCCLVTSLEAQMKVCGLGGRCWLVHSRRLMDRRVKSQTRLQIQRRWRQVKPTPTAPPQRCPLGLSHNTKAENTIQSKAWRLFLLLSCSWETGGVWMGLVL